MNPFPPGLQKGTGFLPRLFDSLPFVFMALASLKTSVLCWLGSLLALSSRNLHASRIPDCHGLLHKILVCSLTADCLVRLDKCTFTAHSELSCCPPNGISILSTQGECAKILYMQLWWQINKICLICLWCLIWRRASVVCVEYFSRRFSFRWCEDVRMLLYHPRIFTVQCQNSGVSAQLCLVCSTTLLGKLGEHLMET